MRHRGGWVGRLLVGPTLAVALLACGSETPATPSGPTAPVAPVTVAPSTPPSLVAPTAASVGLAVPDSCPQPWSPVHAGGSVYGAPTPADWPREVAPVDGPSIDWWLRAYDPPDTDGDGLPDVVGTTAEGAAVTIERGDGLVELILPGVVGFPGGRMTEGDLDGDGRDDLVLFVSSFEGGTSRTDDAIVVVPGSVSVGSHDPFDVGVRVVSSTAPAGVLVGVGDRDGDGADDVSWEGAVVPGPALLEPGPGGHLDRRPAAIGVLPERSVGLLVLDPDQPPVVVTASGEGSGQVELTLALDPEVVLRTARLAWPGGDVARWSVTGWLSNGHRIVSLRRDGGRSGDGQTWSWDLDDPCAGPTPATG